MVQVPITLFSLLFFLLIGTLQAQMTPSKAFLQQQNQFIQVDGDYPTADAFFSDQARALGLEGSEMRLVRQTTGHQGYVHERYQQYYQDILVFGSSYILHQREGRIHSASGYYLPLIDLNINPQLDPSEAIIRAKRKMIETAEIQKESQLTLNAFEQEVPVELVIIDRAFPNASELYLLAYQVELTTKQPFDRRQYLVDAHSGQIITDLPLLMHEAVPAVAETRYYGPQIITVDSVAPDEYYLHDPTRGNDGITIWDEHHKVPHHGDTHWDLPRDHDHDVALDAMYCTASFYDYMKEYHHWEGLDGAGASMNCVVNAGDFVNAYWNRSYAVFGDGDCNRGPLTTLEVIAHEFTHGLTDHTSQLIYAHESGAINESMSDIFGKACEYYYDPDRFNWWVGGSFTTSSFSEPFRSFEDPHYFEHPKYYRGQYWFDYSWVHTNSSIGNHWFYNLIEGGEGVNEVGEAYHIHPLSWEDAMDLVWCIQKNYLVPNADYPFLYEASLLAAAEVFGISSSKIAAVEEAWKVVGLPGDQALPDQIDLMANFTTFFEKTCLNGAFYGTQIEIVNLGTQDYYPEMGARAYPVQWPIHAPDTIYVQDTILAGHKKLYDLEHAIYLDERKDVQLVIKLDFHDDHDLNNHQIMYLSNFPHQHHDLSLSATMEEMDCHHHHRQIHLMLLNESCEEIPAGAAFDIFLSADPNINIQKSYALPETLPSGAPFYISEWINTQEIELNQDIQIELQYADDVYLANNHSSVAHVGLPWIREAMQYDIGMMPSPFLEKEYGGRVDQTSYQGEVMLRTLGNTFGLSTPLMCPNPERNATDPHKLVLTMEACLDLSDLRSPEMAFDLAQFRDDSFDAIPKLIGQTAIVMAEWTYPGGDSENYIVWNQPEGEVMKHTLALPEAYKGKIKFYFSNRQGTPHLDQAYDFDVNLFDHFEIYDGVVQTTRTPDEPEMWVYPNPTSGLLNLAFGGKGTQLQCVNLQGQLLQVWQVNAPTMQIDLGEIPKGMYVFRLLEGSQVVSIQKVAVL